MRTVAIIQARMGSTRLSGKVLLPLVGKPVLWHVWQRLEAAQLVDAIVVATSTLTQDDPIGNFALSQCMPCYRGSETNVLSRHYEAASESKADVVVRMPADKPVLSPKIVDQVIAHHVATGADYTSNMPATFPEGCSFPTGLEVEVFNFSALEQAYEEADQPYQLEHVTPFIYENSDRFSIQQLEATGKLNRPELRMTLDTQEDFEFIEAIYERLYTSEEPFTTDAVLRLLDSSPELLKINSGVRQKGLRN
jgi:spore coat polysaccharide biosynthesis protein SpsF